MVTTKTLKIDIQRIKINSQQYEISTSNIMVYIKPRHAMMASTPTNIYVSFSNLKSTGLG